jgi:hypothetical protein
MSDVSRILSKIESGDPLVYDELRKLAAARLAHQKPGQTLARCQRHPALVQRELETCWVGISETGVAW